MSTYILTSMFPNGFHGETKDVFLKLIKGKKRFAMIASEFEKMHDKTDYYFHFFRNMFEKIGICFEEAYVVDGRMSFKEAQDAAAKADVIWLSGGDTPTQYHYLKKYGLDSVLRQHEGIIIGMSAGSINLAETSICTVSCGHLEQKIYQGLGCVNLTVEPHFVRTDISDELIELSNKYTIYGLCDESLIVCTDQNTEFCGEIYKINGGCVERI